MASFCLQTPPKVSACEQEGECPVCFLHYSRQERVPRLLHCWHTFCTPCLERLATTVSGLRTVRCPLCRWTTCMFPNVSLQEKLWVNIQQWDQIPDTKEGEEEEEEETQLPPQSECPGPKRSRKQSKLYNIRRKLQCMIPIRHRCAGLQ